MDKFVLLIFLIICIALIVVVAMYSGKTLGGLKTITDFEPILDVNDEMTITELYRQLLAYRQLVYWHTKDSAFNNTEYGRIFELRRSIRSIEADYSKTKEYEFYRMLLQAELLLFTDSQVIELKSTFSNIRTYLLKATAQFASFDDETRIAVNTYSTKHIYFMEADEQMYEDIKKIQQKYPSETTNLLLSEFNKFIELNKDSDHHCYRIVAPVAQEFKNTMQPIMDARLKEKKYKDKQLSDKIAEYNERRQEVKRAEAKGISLDLRKSISQRTKPKTNVDEKCIELFTKGITDSTLNGILYGAYKFHKSIKGNTNNYTISIGSGNGAYEYAAEQKYPELKIICVEPKSFNDSWYAGDIYKEPDYEFARDVVNAHPELIGNCTLLLNWCFPDMTYDLEAVKLLKPLSVIARGGDFGSSAGNSPQLYEYLDNRGDYKEVFSNHEGIPTKWYICTKYLSEHFSRCLETAF